MVCSIGIPYPNFVSYAEDNSFAEGQTAVNSRWYGRGAELLQLQGEVTSIAYKNAYRGMNDRGESLRRKLKGRNSLSGRDLTFSAPKSVSVLALVKEDKQLLDAHNLAVERSLWYIEQNCIYTRTGKGGSHKQQTQNMVAAVFQHSENRNFDPNLHSHCVIFNQTQGQDGKWRAMDNRELYQQRITAGLVYHHELARQLIELGHTITWNKNGTFDIANFQPEQLKPFSSRRAEIIQLAGQNSSSKVKARACVSTRNKKRYLKADERIMVRANWKKTLANLNLSSTSTQNINPLNSGKTSQNLPSLLSVKELTERTVRVLNQSKHKTRFRKHELLKELLIQAQGQHKLELLQKELDTYSGLIEIESGSFTTTKLYQQEKAQTQKIERSKLTIQQEDKELDTLELTNLASDNESHLKQTNSASGIEKFSLVKANNLNSKISQAVESYLQQIENSQGRVIILTDTKAEANKLTNNVRQQLIQRQKLGANPVRSVCLQRKSIDKQDLAKTEKYQVGNMVKFNRQSKKFDNWHLYKVLKIDADLVLKHN